VESTAKTGTRQCTELCYLLSSSLLRAFLSWIIKRARFSRAPGLQHSTHLATSLGKILSRKYICCVYIKSTVKIVGCRKNVSHRHCFGGAGYEPSKTLSHEVHNGDAWGRPCAVMKAQCSSYASTLVTCSPTLCSHEAYGLLAHCAARESCLGALAQGRLDPCWGQHSRVLVLASAGAQCREQGSYCQALKVFQEGHGKSQVPRAGVHNNWPAEEVKGRKAIFRWLLVKFFDSSWLLGIFNSK